MPAELNPSKRTVLEIAAGPQLPNSSQRPRHPHPKHPGYRHQPRATLYPDRTADPRPTKAAGAGRLARRADVGWRGSAPAPGPMKEVPAVAERLGLVALELAALPSSRRIGRIR